MGAAKAGRAVQVVLALRRGERATCLPSRPLPAVHVPFDRSTGLTSAAICCLSPNFSICVGPPESIRDISLRAPQPLPRFLAAAAQVTHLPQYHPHVAAGASCAVAPAAPTSGFAGPSPG